MPIKNLTQNNINAFKLQINGQNYDFTPLIDENSDDQIFYRKIQDLNNLKNSLSPEDYERILTNLKVNGLDEVMMNARRQSIVDNIDLKETATRQQEGQLRRFTYSFDGINYDFSALLTQNSENSEFVIAYNQLRQLDEVHNDDQQKNLINDLNANGFNAQSAFERYKRIQDEIDETEAEAPTTEDQIRYEQTDQQRQLQEERRTTNQIDKEYDENIEKRIKEIQEEHLRLRQQSLQQQIPQTAKELIQNERKKAFERFDKHSLARLPFLADKEDAKIEKITTENRLDPAVIQRLYEADALNNPFMRQVLTREQKAELKKLGSYKSNRRAYFEQKVEDLANRGITRLTGVSDQNIRDEITRINQLDPQNKRIWTKIVNNVDDRRKKKKKGITGLIGAAGSLAAHYVKKPLSLLKDVAKSTRLVRKAIRIKDTANGKWNNFKQSRALQRLNRIRNTGKALGNGFRHLRGGFRTGALLGIPAALVFGGPAGIALAASGTLAGATRSFLTSASAADLSDFSPTSIKSLDKLRLRIALSNTKNIGLDINKLNPRAKSLLQSLSTDLKLEGLPTDQIGDGFYRKLGNLRGLTNALKALDFFGVGMIAGSVLGLGTGAAVGLGVGAAAGGYAINRAASGLSRSIQLANPRVLNLLKYPGGSVLNIVGGASTINEQLGILQSDGLDGLVKDQSKSLFENINLPGSKGIANALGTLGFVQGTSALTNFASGFVVKAAALPLALKLAPLIVPAGYIALSLATGSAITVGGILAATAVGVTATVAGVLVGGATFGVGGVATYAGVTAAAYGSGAAQWLASKIDGFFGTLEDAVGGFQNLASLFGVYNLFKALKDLIEGTINKLSDYATALTIAITFMTTFTIIQTISETYSQAGPPIANDETITSTYQIQNEQNLATFDFPDLEIDCNQLDNPEVTSNYSFRIEEIIKTEQNGEIKEHVKGDLNNGQKIIIKNLESAAVDQLGKVEEGTVVGNCS